MKPSQYLDVRAAAYESRFEKLSSDTVKFTRVHRRADRGSEIDALGPFWSVTVGEILDNRIGVVASGRPVFYSGIYGAFIPAFGVVEWCYGPGTHTYEAVLSTAKLPAGMPEEPIYFSATEATLPESIPEIVEWIRNAKGIATFGRQFGATAVARRTKFFLDAHFLDDISLSATAGQLNYSPSVMTRAFTKTYGMSPVSYRNRLRVMESLRLMLLQDTPVGAAYSAAGFGDQSRFNRHFRGYTRLPPSKFGRRMRT